MGLVIRFLRWLWRRFGDYNDAVTLADMLDFKTAIAGALGFVGMMLFGAFNYGSSPQEVVLAALLAGACVAVIFIALRMAGPLLLRPKSPYEGDARPDTTLIQAQAELLKQQRLREKQNDPTRRSPASRAAADPYDNTVRWALEYMASGTTFKGDVGDAPGELRQAARNGVLTIYGRPDSGHHAADNFYKPIEPISPEHWRNFGFDTLRCIFHDDPRECRTEPDDTRSTRYGEAYVDLRVNSAEIMQRWPRTRATSEQARERLWELRKTGVALRNEGMSTRLADQWREKFEEWHADVLEQAALLSIDLRHSLDPIDKIRPESNERVAVPDPHHQKRVSVMSEMLARLYEHLKKE